MSIPRLTRPGTAVLLVVLMGCGNGTGTPTSPSTSSPTTTTTLATTTTTQQASTTTLEPTVLWESTQYPYRLELSSDNLGTWRGAAQAWDGVARIDNGGPLVDRVRLEEGVFFVFGAPTGQDLDGFVGLIAADAAQNHGCTEDSISSDGLALDGVEGLMLTYTCAGGADVIRWIGIKDGFGLVMVLIVDAGRDPAAVEAILAERLTGFEWTG